VSTSALRDHSVALHIHFHDLRHIFASLMLLAGIQPKIVSEMLGPSSSMAFTVKMLVTDLDVDTASGRI
jgi:integrase